MIETGITLQEDRLARRRKGQTLAEFAITLPILLILLFGIIEFGRIFQAWVTLQNAARTAVRYATTGSYDDKRYNIDTIVPCVSTDQRGTRQKITPDPLFASYFIDGYKGGSESLFATWYDGSDCDPGSDNDQERRKDILRIVSIIDQARIGAAGLSLPPNPNDATMAGVTNELYSVWDRPIKDSSSKGWFNVMICSSRAFANDKSHTYEEVYKGVGTSTTRIRFATIMKDSDSANSSWYAGDVSGNYPYCMLNEVQPSDANATNNAGIRWLDAGGPGDQITLTVTYNHPLITPLGLTQYIQMQTRRTAVNESFRASKAVLAPQGSSPIGGSFDTPTPLPPTNTLPPPTNTPKPPTNTPKPPTPTASPIPPFSCSKITVSDVSFFTNQAFVNITNDNAQSTSLVRVRLNWSTLSDYPGMFVSVMSLNSEAHWLGKDTQPNTDSIAASDNQDPTLPGDIPTSDRSVFGGGTLSTWQVVFNNGPNSLGQYFTPFTFGGSIFSFLAPDGVTICDIKLDLTDVPTNTPTPANQPTATKTFTPNCASSQVTVSFAGFDQFGVVKFTVQNQRPVVAPLSAMNITWPQRQAGVLNLAKVTVGGSNPDDTATVVVWRGGSATASPAFPGDFTANSVSAALNVQNADGMWVSNFTFPPNSTTTIYLDFDGTSSTLPNAFNMVASDFNGTFFTIGCGATGTTGTTAGNNSGPIYVNTQVPPPPTNTPKPTNTPGPTLTPSKTYTPAPPTLTPTKAPPTSTVTKAPPTKTPAPTDVPLPTQPGTKPGG